MLPGNSPPFWVLPPLPTVASRCRQRSNPLAAGICFALFAMTGRIFYLIALRVGMPVLFRGSCSQIITQRKRPILCQKFSLWSLTHRIPHGCRPCFLSVVSNPRQRQRDPARQVEPRDGRQHRAIAIQVARPYDHTYGERARRPQAITGCSWEKPPIACFASCAQVFSVFQPFWSFVLAEFQSSVRVVLMLFQALTAFVLTAFQESVVAVLIAFQACSTNTVTFSTVFTAGVTIFVLQPLPCLLHQDFCGCTIACGSARSLWR